MFPTAVHCPPVIAPPYGSAQIPSLQCGAHVRYSCDPNFNLIGRSEAECLGDGTWSSPTPHCTSMTWLLRTALASTKGLLLVIHVFDLTSASLLRDCINRSTSFFMTV